MYDQCKEVGPKYCMQVKYEDLVLHPRPTLKKILKFADLEWTENVMEHQKHMGDISLSAVEKSTDQVDNSFLKNSNDSRLSNLFTPTPSTAGSVTYLKMLKMIWPKLLQC